MVKRPKSPSTVQDTRLYTIVNPFPLYANWALEEDQLKCYYWIFACVRDRNAICSVLEKPSSRNMIIVELSKSFTDRAKFLGEHKWSQFLKKPTDQERPRATQVFDSRMSTFRDAEKAGWKPFKISPDEAFGPNVTKASIFRSPYPPTSWCAPPPEEKTGEPLCRPLPKDTKPPPPAPLPPVPGSTKWVSLQKPATAEPEPAPSPTPVISPAPQPPVPKDDEPWPTPKGTAALDFPALPDAIPARQSRFVPLNKPKANGNGNSGSGSGGGFSKVNANSGAVATGASKVSKNKPVSLNTLHNTRPSVPAPKHKAPTSSPWNKTPWQTPSNNSSAPAAPRNLDPSWEKPNSKNAWAKRPTITPDPKPSTTNAIPRRERLDPNGHLWDVPDQELYSRFEELKVGDAAATSNGTRDDAAPKIDFESKAAISWADCADAEYPLEPYSATVEEVTPADAYAYDDEDDEEDNGTQPWQILASAVHAAPDSLVESADTTTDAGDSGADDGWTSAPTTSRGSRRFQGNANGGISSRRGSSNAYYGEKEEEPPLVCPTHKALCSAGICKDYSKAKRARERERAFQKRGGGKCGNGNRAQSRLRAGALAANDGPSA